MVPNPFPGKTACSLLPEHAAPFHGRDLPLFCSGDAVLPFLRSFHRRKAATGGRPPAFSPCVHAAAPLTVFLRPGSGSLPGRSTEIPGPFCIGLLLLPGTASEERFSLLRSAQRFSATLTGEVPPQPAFFLPRACPLRRHTAARPGSCPAHTALLPQHGTSFPRLSGIPARTYGHAHRKRPARFPPKRMHARNFPPRRAPSQQKNARNGKFFSAVRFFCRTFFPFRRAFPARGNGLPLLSVWPFWQILVSAEAADRRSQGAIMAVSWACRSWARLSMAAEVQVRNWPSPISFRE